MSGKLFIDTRSLSTEQSDTFIIEDIRRSVFITHRNTGARFAIVRIGLLGEERLVLEIWNAGTNVDAVPDRVIDLLVDADDPIELNCEILAQEARQEFDPDRYAHDPQCTCSHCQPSEPAD